MTHRTTDAYVAALKKVNDEIIELKGSGIIIDFENAMRAALKIVAPNLPIFGCWFHYNQALRRMMTSIKPLFDLIRTNDDAKLLFRKFQCLALLPANKVKDAFVYLLREALHVHNFTSFAPFIDYFKKQWLTRVTPTHFSIFNQSVRTTGSAEAFNGKVNKKFRTHGDFFHFVETLQKEELAKVDEFCRHMGGKMQPDRRKNFYKKRTELIGKYSRRLEAKEINYKYFLNIMTNVDNDVFFDEDEMFVDEIDINMTKEMELISGDEIHGQQNVDASTNVESPTIAKRTTSRQRADSDIACSEFRKKNLIVTVNRDEVRKYFESQEKKNCDSGKQSNEESPTIAKRKTPRQRAEIQVANDDALQNIDSGARSNKRILVIAKRTRSKKAKETQIADDKTPQNIDSNARANEENPIIAKRKKSRRAKENDFVESLQEHPAKRTKLKGIAKKSSCKRKNTAHYDTGSDSDSDSNDFITKVTRKGPVLARLQQRFDDILERGEIATEDNGMECIMGCGRKKTTVLLPCKHQYTCEPCWYLWKVHQLNENGHHDFLDENIEEDETKPICPVCKQAVNEAFSVFN